MLDEENKLENTESSEESKEEENVQGEQELQAGINAGLSDVATVDLVKQSFLDYAMSVIVARAIPDVRDGMKPVHRRIIFSMNESGNTPDKPFVKCARIVGDVMGKYHPHGDSAIYGAVVRLAQPFAMRYCLVDGHGNFGSMDGDSAAAYRYTEARLQKLALEMVRDINANAVDFVDNYDGTEQEPAVLPSRFPNLLVNGSNGIAVGMATNMPPHNLGEVIDGVIAIAHNPEMTTEELMNIVKGPDFPTGGIILGRGGIREAYETGTGSITIRSKCHIEERSSGLKQIVVTEVPYQVNKATMVEAIGNLVRDKIIEGISDIRDVSNKDGVKIIIEVKRDAIPEVVLNQLYKLTSLQVSYGIINLCLVNNAPKICSLSALLNNYLEFQIDVVRRRTEFYLEKDTARDHIVFGLLKCHDNIDDIVDIIKESATPEDASNKLMAKYDFSEAQVQAILGMTLRRLTGIETDKLEAERAQLEKNIAEYNRILSSRENIIEVIAKELTEIKERFGDERRTTISDSDASIDDEDLIPQEDIIVTLSRGGYIKRLASDTFRAQHRGGRGIKGMTTNEHDIVEEMLYTKTHTDLLMFTSFGRVYRIRGYQIPEFNRNSKGIPVINLIPIEKEEKLEAIVPCDEYSEDSYLMFFTEQGLIKKTPLSEFANIRANGKIAIALKEGDALLAVKPVKDDTIVGIAGSNAKMVNFVATEARPMGRDTMGVKGIELPEGEKVVGVTTSEEGKYILSITNKGFGKLTDIDSGDVDENGNMVPAYRITKRGAKGVTAMKTNDKIGNLIAVRAVSIEDDLMAITNGGIVIRTHLSEIRLASRNTQGVKIVNLEPRQKVVSIAVVPHEDESEEEFVEDEEATEEAKDGSDVNDTSLE